MRDRFEAFQRRDLYAIRIAALFLDAVFLSVRRDGPKEGVLVAWGSTEDGERVLLSVMLGMRGSTATGSALGRPDRPRARRADADGRRRRARADQSDCPAVLAGLRWHRAVHRVRNLLAKVPDRERSASAASTGKPSMRRSARATDADDSWRWSAISISVGYTAAAKCLADDLEAVVVHLRYPTRHRRRWRSTNLLERSLGEVKRRTKVIGRFPGETSCLTLVWVVLDLYISHATNGIKFTQLERQQLKRMRDEGNDPTTAEEVSAA